MVTREMMRMARPSVPCCVMMRLPRPRPLQVCQADTTHQVSLGIPLLQSIYGCLRPLDARRYDVFYFPRAMVHYIARELVEPHRQSATVCAHQVDLHAWQRRAFNGTRTRESSPQKPRARLGTPLDPLDSPERHRTRSPNRPDVSAEISGGKGRADNPLHHKSANEKPTRKPDCSLARRAANSWLRLPRQCDTAERSQDDDHQGRCAPCGQQNEAD
jgi:hypothetical protein